MGEDWPRAEAEAPGKRKKGILLRTQLLLVGSTLVSLMGMLGGFNWRLELLSHFIAWYALGSAVLAIALFFLGARRWSVAAALLALLQAIQPLGWYLPPSDTPATNGPALRILLANVLTSNRNTDAFLELVRDEDPDIICVQEANGAWIVALEELESDYPMHHAVPRNDNFGIAIYSRVSPSLPTTILEESIRIPMMTVPVEMDGTTINLLSIHTLPPLGKEHARIRNRHLGATRAWYEAQDCPAIIVGDLNMTMYSPIYRGWLAGLDLKNTREGHGPLGTFPVFSPILRLPLDQCLVSPSIEVVDCRLGPDIGSDHLPLIVDLRLPR
jgi:endonuclease/exonuclease/phosphatase (EEP) superfamily protein YafD